MLKFAFRNLMSRPVRSALSLLGLTVAIAGMVGLFAVKGGLEKTVNDTFRFIPGLTVMQPGSPVPLFSKLPADWADELRGIDGVGAVNPQIVTRANLIEGRTTLSPPRLLVGLEISSRLKLRRDVYREKVVAGRFLRESDAGTFNTVVSEQIARGFNKTVGDDLLCDGRRLHIVGIYNTGLPLLDVAIILDLDSLRQMTRFDPRSVGVFYLETSDPELDDEAVKRRIEAHFAKRSIEQIGSFEKIDPEAMPPAVRTGNPAVDLSLWILGQVAAGRRQETKAGNGSGPPPPTGVEVRTGDDWTAKLDEFSADLDIFLVIMTGIGVTVAVLSIINTMLMSVTERIIEFGILKANGWSRRDVLKLITLESGLIGIGGGIFGAIAGWLATLGLNAYWPDKLHLFAGPGLLSFSVAFATLVGTLGGLYPAVWAMRMMPMDAIRRG
jgi:putative ABC transport system permease protein